MRQFTEANKNGVHRDNSLSWILDKRGAFHYISTMPVVAGAIVSGRKAVTVAGTAETLVATSTPCLWVEVSGDTGNTDLVVVGGSGVVAAASSQAGTVIIPGNPPIRIKIDNVQKLYVDAITSGDAITFNYFTE